MTLYFITGNKNKFAEVKAVLPQVEQLEIDLPEIQDLDPRNVVAAKLREALSHKQGEFIVEDTSLRFNCLNGLPGTLIKWFLKTLGNQGLYDITQKMENNSAEAHTIIGYARSPTDIHYFEGTMNGHIVAPAGPNDFGWDVIFQPEGHTQTYAQLGREEKNNISMRRQALNKLESFLH